MEVRFKKSFIKELVNCPKGIQKRVQMTIEKIENSISLEEAEIDFVYIKGQSKNENYIRIRLGQYRIGAEFIYPNVLMITIGTRGDIYKTFP